MNRNEKHCLANLLMYLDMSLWKATGHTLTEEQKNACEGIEKHYPEFANIEDRHQLISWYLDELCMKEA